MRTDVRRDPAPEVPSEPVAKPDDCRRRHVDDYSPYGRYQDGSQAAADASGQFWGLVVGGTVMAPYWIPHVLAGDNFSQPLHFEPYPYFKTPGRMVEGLATTPREAWGGRLRFEYGDEFRDIQQVGFGLLLEHQCRLGLDMESHWLGERLTSGRNDSAWLGDANAVFRFAQGERMACRSGVGLNWLADDVRANLGFNFTYGVDLFPARPWVVSADIDLGTLGNTSLFRFRASGGLIINRVETFVGYEYLDIGRTQSNSLLAGLRLWF